ncbi:MAG TPA: MBL fold metallo-hydrolase [Capillimicrobium sp.]|nr:MBL fold metallo-hydrolase [Capillimicrobium sp.]
MIAGVDVALVRAANPGPLTLTGTNTWLFGRDPCWIVDPGPALDEHLDAVAAEAAARGGAGGIAITHDHPDHVEGLAPLRARLGGDALPVASDGELGPLRALATPGHSPDSVTWLAGRAAFTGDAVLGSGSVFVFAQLGEYLAALEQLRALDLDLLLPGHGDPVLDPAARIGELIEHRLDRERRLLAALDRGARTVDELLDDAWSDAPPALRLPATVTLGAHLDKLAAEGRLPAGVERPRF